MAEVGVSYDIDDHVREHFAAYYALTWLIETLRTIVPLAAAAQVGTCLCDRAAPWERAYWSSPRCYTCEPEIARDRARRARYEQIVVQACGDELRERLANPGRPTT